MSKPTIGQSHMVIQILANNADWDNLNHLILQKIIDDPKEAGKQFTAFLNNGGKVIVDSPRVININRSIPFDPITFIGDGWSIVEQDKRAIALTKIDLTKIIFESTLERGEKYIIGEEKIKRLKEKTDHIRLDAGVLKTLWENQDLIPEKWKEKTNRNITYIFFDGTVLRNPEGKRCSLCLFWNDGEWHWNHDWLGHDLGISRPSAII